MIKTAKWPFAIFYRKIQPILRTIFRAVPCTIPSCYYPAFRTLALSALFLTGFTSLCAQVVWQKYLSILVGSEARSITLVVALFLSGLALGYWAFGLLTKKENSRQRILKLYGFVEILTALYICLFPFYFSLLKSLAFNSPPWLFIDLLITGLSLLLPTFLMGASIPVLTAVLPKDWQEVPALHTKIYGWNSLGACLGALVCGFFFLPAFGLKVSLMIAGVLNFLAGLVFVLNQLEGTIQKPQAPPLIPSFAPDGVYLSFAFFIGAIIISFEILLIRVLNLSLGAGVYNFPFILSIFIGSLACGSLSINKDKVASSYFIRQILISILCTTFLYITIPYWPIWLNHIRVSLETIPSNYIVFKVLVFLFLSIFIFPALFFMGRLLPLTYTLSKKGKNNYGDICGRLYGMNTLGAVFGAVFLGYLAFYVFDIDYLFKINIYLLIILALVFVFYEKKYIWALLLISICFTVFTPVNWDRTGHYVGYFRNKAYNPLWHFRGWFFLPDTREPTTETRYFKDGPGATVTLLNNLKQPATSANNLQVKKDSLFPNNISPYDGYSLIINGKPDGNTKGDFSNMFLSASLAYLFFNSPTTTSEEREGLKQEDDRKLSSAVIGLGTGISAGVLSKIEDIEEVKVLEISPKVIKALQGAPSAFNFELLSNPKVHIVETDAFRYFTRSQSTYDIIVSQPTNPWVSGVENLFSLEFYELAHRSLSPSGVLAQWLNSYDIDEVALRMVLYTVRQVFKYVELYRVGYQDVLILASQTTFNREIPDHKFSLPFLKKFHQTLGIHSKEDLFLISILDADTIDQMFSFTPSTLHTLQYPRLSYRADKSFFLGWSSDPFSMVPELDFIMDTSHIKKKRKAFEKHRKKSLQEQAKHCLSTPGFDFLCRYMRILLAEWNVYKDSGQHYTSRLKSYILLIKWGLIEPDDFFLDDISREVLEKKHSDFNFLWSHLKQRLRGRSYDKAYKDIALFQEKGLINSTTYQSWKNVIDNVKNSHLEISR